MLPEPDPRGERHCRPRPREADLPGHLALRVYGISMKRPLKPRRIGSILRGEGRAGELAAKARLLLRVERTVHRILGGESNLHVRAASLSRDSITLLVDSPAWASITRFKGPDICGALRSDLPRLRRTRVLVAADAPGGPMPPPATHRSLSPAAAHVLRSTARAIDNPRLSRVLIRLAGRRRYGPPDDSGPPPGTSAPGSFGLNRRWPAGRR